MTGMALAGLLAAAACTKVNPQPQAADMPAAPPPAAPALPRAPVPRSGWGAEPAPAANVGAPLTGLKRDAALPPAGKPLDRDKLQAVINAAMGTFAACAQGGPPGTHSMTVSFEATPSGRAESIKVAGGFPAADGCIVNAVRGLALPTFEGTKPEQVGFPITVVQPAAPPPPPPPPPPTAYGMPAQGATVIRPPDNPPTFVTPSEATQPPPPPSVAGAPSAPPTFVNP